MHGNYGLFWLNDDFFDECIEIIDQRRLPFEYHTKYLTDTKEVINAIQELPHDGGAIRTLALFGIYISTLEVEGDYEKIVQKADLIKESRYDIPNLAIAVDEMINTLKESQNIIEDARRYAIYLSDELEQQSKKMAEHGCEVIENIFKNSSKEEINILLHSSNKTIFTLIHEAMKRELNIHVWVEASEHQALWELSKSGVRYSVINESGSLLQDKEIDLVIVGAIMVDESGKITNKAGTYLKALGAYESGIPFYVATLDLDFGFLATPIQPEKKPFLVKGVDGDGVFREITTTQEQSKSISYSFDNTPAKFISGFITHNGIYKADFDKIGKKINQRAVYEKFI